MNVHIYSAYQQVYKPHQQICKREGEELEITPKKLWTYLQIYQLYQQICKQQEVINVQI